ncbi:hypothetical protein ACQPYK_00770 [Streptosporangium sp. CA-135522]|uniref:hypothetical protein n=1 Tax=Streptosporangium sp. CA-135522 TaxID=3240072 RepID=UPI003D91C60A
MGYPPQYGRPPRGETGRGVAVIVIMVVGVLIGAAISVIAVLNPAVTPKALSAPRDSGHSETAVRQAAQVGLDSYSGGSYGEFWDMWSTQAQTAIPREEYARLFQLCPQPVADVRFTITTVTVTGDDARVQATRGGDTTDFDFFLESGSWRHVPPSEELQEYRTKGVDQLARERQAAGTCGAVTPAPTPSATDPSTSTGAPSDPATDPSTSTGAPSHPATDPSSSTGAPSHPATDPSTFTGAPSDPATDPSG